MNSRFVWKPVLLAVLFIVLQLGCSKPATDLIRPEGNYLRDSTLISLKVGDTPVPVGYERYSLYDFGWYHISYCGIRDSLAAIEARKDYSIVTVPFNMPSDRNIEYVRPLAGTTFYSDYVGITFEVVSCKKEVLVLKIKR
jgi:hypothetical protein